jgi:hypothetical protein
MAKVSVPKISRGCKPVTKGHFAKGHLTFELGDLRDLEAVFLHIPQEMQLLED